MTTRINSKCRSHVGSIEVILAIALTPPDAEIDGAIRREN